MRIVSPSDRNGRNGHRPPAIPAWYREWLENQGKWIELRCGCIEDLRMPQCIVILTSKPEIDCPNGHGFQRIKRSIKFTDVMRIRYGIDVKDIDQDPLIPPF